MDSLLLGDRMPLRRNSSQRSIAKASYIRKLGVCNTTTGIPAAFFQTIVTVMACLYYGLYAWNWDAPVLAKSSTGILSGALSIALGSLQITAAGMLRISSRVDVDGKFCVIKILNCLSMLLALLMIGISIYLLYVIHLWLLVDSPEYQQFIRGPVSGGIALNICQGITAVVQLVTAFLGLVYKDF